MQLIISNLKLLGVKHNNFVYESNLIDNKLVLKIVKKLKFPKISLKQNIEKASELILLDRQHLDNNPREISKEDIRTLLQAINEPEN